MTCIQHVLAHMDTVVLVHRQKHLRSRDPPAIGDPFVWLGDPGGPLAPCAGEDTTAAAGLTRDDPEEAPHQQGPPVQIPVEGYEDVDFAAFSDMELSQPHQPAQSAAEDLPDDQKEEWPRAVLTAIGYIQMDEATFLVYRQFSRFQAQWLSATDQMYALSILFQSESLPRKA